MVLAVLCLLAVDLLVRLTILHNYDPQELELFGPSSLQQFSSGWQGGFQTPFLSELHSSALKENMEDT